MTNNGTILDSGYVIYDPERDDYYTSNTGIFKTKRNAQKQCDLMRRYYAKKAEVIKVNLVITEE